MPKTHDAATVERARALVEGSARTLETIAVAVGVSGPTLRNWIVKHGWTRPAQAPRAVPKLPPEKEEPARRVFENRAGVGDLARLLSCDESYVWRLAKQRGWERASGAAGAGGAAAEPSDELKGVEAALRDPALNRSDFVRLAERAVVLLATEAMVSGDAGLDRRINQLDKLVDLARRLPDPAAALATPRDSAPPEDEELTDEEFVDFLERLTPCLLLCHERMGIPLPAPAPYRPPPPGSRLAR